MVATDLATCSRRRGVVELGRARCALAREKLLDILGDRLGRRDGPIALDDLAVLVDQEPARSYPGVSHKEWVRVAAAKARTFQSST